MSDIKEEESFEGLVEGVLIIVRGNHDDPWMIRLQAKHETSIKTQMHTHLRNHKCLEVMIVSCEAPELREMLNDVRAEGKADYMRFVRG
jgi:CopG family nickel-responsive transcriptional regulator